MQEPMNDYSVTQTGTQFAIHAAGKALLTPLKLPMHVPTQALADAMAAEWRTHGKFAAGKMPLTTLAQTAIDRIEQQRELIVESLLTYVDTDALVYRSNSSQKLAQTQKLKWDPVLNWSANLLKAKWEVTTGVMPVDQSAELHDGIREYLQKLDTMRLSAACMLSASFSSVALAIAVVEKHIDAETAFHLSRLEEESQAETWGRDFEADKRAARMQEEIVAAGHFLDLLGSR